MPREAIPKVVRDKVLNEYSHRCAICGCDRPHIHHIDEDSSNNEVSNLLPLCPNCHLTDQHNPTRKVEVPKLKLFRSYKDPAILKPQFHPIYQRMSFLNSIEAGAENTNAYELDSKELIAFIAMFEMGGFYSEKIKSLIEAPPVILIGFGGRTEESESESRKYHSGYRNKLISNREHVIKLIIALLRYQGWANA